MTELKLKVDGMHCGSCVKRVTTALEKIEGVEVKQVSIGTAQVSFEPAETNVGAIAAALTRAGYPASEVAP